MRISDWSSDVCSSDLLERLWRVAESLNPKGVLRRGYALVTDTSGHVVTSAAGARAARRVSLQFADGGVDATIGSDESAPRAPAPQKAEIGRAQGGERVCKYVYLSGGAVSLKKKKKKK